MFPTEFSVKYDTKNIEFCHNVDYFRVNTNDFCKFKWGAVMEDHGLGFLNDLVIIYTCCTNPQAYQAPSWLCQVIHLRCGMAIDIWGIRAYTAANIIDIP